MMKVFIKKSGIIEAKPLILLNIKVHSDRGLQNFAWSQVQQFKHTN
jgi:hypothetical protein